MGNVYPPRFCAVARADGDKLELAAGALRQFGAAREQDLRDAAADMAEPRERDPERSPHGALLWRERFAINFAGKSPRGAVRRLIMTQMHPPAPNSPARPEGCV